MTLSEYQKNFVKFLVESDVLTFGDFVTKSGRRTPYFVNTGEFDSGSRISQLGEFYADHIHKIGLGAVQSIFGPAYKGIPLCVSTAFSLYQRYSPDVGFTFNRKEEKEHGDKGLFVGRQLQENDQVLLVEDVITAGTTLREIVPKIQEQAKVNIRGVVISVDRCEKGAGDLTASKEVEKNLGIQVYPLVTIHEVVQYLSAPNDCGFVLSQELQERVREYLEEYGA